MSDDFEFEDGEQVNKEAPKAAEFDAFADEEVDTKAAPPAPPAAARKSAPSSSDTADAKAGFDSFDDVAEEDPDAESANDDEIKPGQGKDLWTCPHCGAKSKPNRDTCRNCGKSPDEEVIIPLFSRPPVKFGAIGGAVVFLLILFSIATSVDVSLHQAGADYVGESYNDNGSTVAGTGRVYKVSAGKESTEVIIVFGEKVTIDKEFSKFRYSAKKNDVSSKGLASQSFVLLKITLDGGDISKIKKGAYLAFTGSYEAESEIDRHIFAVNASNMEWNY